MGSAEVEAAATKQASAFALQFDDAHSNEIGDESVVDAAEDDVPSDPDLLRERLLLRSYLIFSLTNF